MGANVTVCAAVLVWAVPPAEEVRFHACILDDILTFDPLPANTRTARPLYALLFPS